MESGIVVLENALRCKSIGPKSAKRFSDDPMRKIKIWSAAVLVAERPAS